MPQSQTSTPNPTSQQHSKDGDEGMGVDFYYHLEPRQLNQKEVDNLIRDLGLSKKALKVLDLG